MIYVFAKIGTTERWAVCAYNLADAVYEAEQFLGDNYPKWKLVREISNGGGLLFEAKDVYYG